MSMNINENDVIWMQAALAEAQKAKKLNEVPIGAVLVANDEIIGAGFNSPIFRHDPTAHAEILALRAGAEKIKNYRLVDTTLYVTLEPCLMCAGAMVHSRIKRLVYGASEPKAGAVISRMTTLSQPFLNHFVEVKGGVLADACGEILTQFFRERR